MAVKRQRSESSAEELLVSNFVASCVNFKTSIQFFSLMELLGLVAGGLSKNILLVGTEPELIASAALLPFHADDITAAIAETAVGSTYGIPLTLPASKHRLTIGKVPVEASRHNCPLRPDAITSIVGAALKDGANVSALDIIVVSQGDQRCIAAAIARAPHSFSAKGGKSLRGFEDAGAKLRVFFPLPVGQDLSIVATSVQLCMRLVDAPPNLLDTVTFAEIASTLGEANGCNVEVIQGEALREGGYGGIYGVGKAAEYPPALVTLTYKPSGGIDPKKKISMVGKGIVYDTGGLAIKTPFTNMCGMKTDMGGAAAVFCGFIAAVQLASPFELSTTLCLADNAIGPRSFRNDDVLLLKSGLSIEVNNTDAEGRLVLSDGVFHAAAELSFTPDVIIDMATLTGAQLIATGKRHAAIYVNDEAAEQAILVAGRKCGDTCFPVLYCPEYHNPEFASKVGDYRNLMAQTNNAGISCAGQFIANNLKSFAGTFVHVDLAGPSADANGGTGFGVALILEYLRSINA
jgi:probable aminopeptidase NPEPL1